MAKLHRDQLHSDALVLIEIFRGRAAPSEVFSMMESVMSALIILRIRRLQGKVSDRLQLRPFDSTGKFCGFESLVRQLVVARLSLNKEDFNLAAEKVFGSANMSFAVIAADLGLMGWKKYYKRVEEKQLQGPRAEIKFGGRAIHEITGREVIIVSAHESKVGTVKACWEDPEEVDGSKWDWLATAELEAIPHTDYAEANSASKSAIHHAEEALKMAVEAQALKDITKSAMPDLGEAWMIGIFGRREPGIYLGDNRWKIYDGTAVSKHVIGKLTLQDEEEDV